jgi:hypothetical protein
MAKEDLAKSARANVFIILFSDSQMIIVKSNTEGFMQKRINPYVLFAQTAFGFIGGFFFIIGVLGTFSWRPGLNSGPSPIIGVFIGLPLIAVAVLLTNLHKKAFGAEDQKILLRCLSCGHLNVEETKYCGNCGKPLIAERQLPASDR